MPFSWESSQPRDQTHISYISCTGRRVPLPLVPPGKPIISASKKHRKIKCCKNGQELVTECERECENWAVFQISTPDIYHRLYLLYIDMSIRFLLNILLLNTVCKLLERLFVNSFLGLISESFSQVYFPLTKPKK